MNIFHNCFTLYSCLQYMEQKRGKRREMDVLINWIPFISSKSMWIYMYRTSKLVLAPVTVLLGESGSDSWRGCKTMELSTVFIFKHNFYSSQTHQRHQSSGRKHEWKCSKHLSCLLLQKIVKVINTTIYQMTYELSYFVEMFNITS